MGCGSSNLTLSKEDLELLKKKTNFSEENIKRWHKVFLKECPSGHLTRNKFVQAYQKMFPNGKSAEFYDHMFRSFDKDKSGALSFVEFMLAVYTTDAGTPEEILELSFRLYDIDNNNKVDSKEIAQILKALYQLKGDNHETGNLCEVRANELMTKMDLDNDKVLSKEEFVQGCLSDEDILTLLSGQ